MKIKDRLDILFLYLLKRDIMIEMTDVQIEEERSLERKRLDKENKQRQKKIYRGRKRNKNREI